MRTQARLLNEWERQLHRQLSSSEADGNLDASDAFVSAAATTNQPASLRVALWQALLQMERAHSD